MWKYEERQETAHRQKQAKRGKSRKFVTVVALGGNGCSTGW